MRWPWQKSPEIVEQAYEQARHLSSAFLPQAPEGCTCQYAWPAAGRDQVASGRPVRVADPQCRADHEGSRDPRQRMRGLRQ